MLSGSPSSRGPGSELHKAAFRGCTERIMALLKLSDGSIDINEADPKGSTPLMIASVMGHSHVAGILLNKGANVSIVADDGFTALHTSAQKGHLTVCKMLVEAGADLEAATTKGSTPLILSAENGHDEVMRVLIEAGANPNSRRSSAGTTPLFIAAQQGRVDAVKMLLRAKADPLLARTVIRSERAPKDSLPLDVAAQDGHLEVVRELVQHVGIDGCGGATGGVEALRLAAANQHVEIMAVLMNSGVVDTGTAITNAVAHGHELSTKFLLQRGEGDEAAYVTYRDNLGNMTLPHAMGFFGFSSPSTRIVRLLVDAGADTTSTVRLTSTKGEVAFNGAPLALVGRYLREKKIAGKDATEDQLHRVEGIRRLLLRVEAVHAVSWLWPVKVPFLVDTAVEDSTRTDTTSTPLRKMLPLLRRRVERPRVLLTALFRSSEKP